MIPYGRQSISDEDINAVVDVLKSDFITQGPVVPAFENAIAKYCGVDQAIAVNSATSALHIACLALGVGEGDEIWTSPITFVASANCGLYCGAKVSFVDIDPDTYNMCAKALKKKLVTYKTAGKTIPKVVIPVHLAGLPCDMEAINTLSDEYGFYIIEDASHAVGGRYQNHTIGDCHYSDITIFSFHPVKVITTAEGGIATTNSFEFAQQMNLLRSHGITRDESLMQGDSHGPWYYQQVALGYNYRMTEMQAALGLSQLKRLDEFVTARHKIAQRYNDLLDDFPVKRPTFTPNSYSALHLYIIQLDQVLNRLAVFKAMRDQDIGVNVHYIPVHLQPYFRNMGFNVGDYPNAETYYKHCISLPMFPTLTIEQQNRVVATLTSIVAAASG